MAEFEEREGLRKVIIQRAGEVEVRDVVIFRGAVDIGLVAKEELEAWYRDAGPRAVDGDVGQEGFLEMFGKHDEVSLVVVRLRDPVCGEALERQV